MPPRPPSPARPPSSSAPARRTLDRDVCASLGCHQRLRPILAALFDGIDALGSTPRRTVNLLLRVARAHAITIDHASSCLDLAGGKGAVAIELARRTGCAVLLLDACLEFLDHAANRAHAAGVADRLTTRCANIATLAPPRSRRDRFDVALMLNAWPIERAAPFLRARTRPGGVYVLDDAFQRREFPAPNPFPDAPTRADATHLIRGLGDDVLAAVSLPRAVAAAHQRTTLAHLAANAARLGRAHPALRLDLRAFLKAHHAAIASLDGPLQSTTWVIRRGED
jgi:SAM-dependent methyltransferase